MGADTEDQFRLLVEGVEEYAIFTLDPAGRVTSWNRGAARIYGYRPDEILGQHCSRFYPAEEAAAGKPGCELEFVARQGRAEVEGWRLRKDGTRFRASVVTTPLRSAAGELVGFGRVTRDLTGRRRAEEEARRLVRAEADRTEAERSLEQIVSLVDASEALLADPKLEAVLPAILEVAGRLIAADAYAVWRMGPGGIWEAVWDAGLGPDYPRRAPDAPGMLVDEPLLIEDVTALPLLQYRQDAYRREQIRSLLVVPLRIAGEGSGTITFYYREPQRFEEPRLRVARALANLAAAAIRTAELYGEQARIATENAGLYADLAYMMEHSRCLLWHVLVEKCEPPSPDYDWSFQVFDEVAAQRFLPLELRPGETYPQAFHRSRPEEDRRSADRHARAAFESGASHYSQEYRCRRRDGAWRWLYEQAHVETAGEGRWRVVVVVTDITDRKRLEEDLRARVAELDRAAQEKDTFLAMLAHELRNPLAASSNALHVLGEPGVPERTRERATEVLARQIRHQTRLVDDLLDVSRITRGLVELHCERLDLVHLAREAGEDHRFPLERAGLTLTLDLPGEPVYVLGDPTRLGQVLGNLLSNAAKFTEAGGKVTVTVRVPSNSNSNSNSKAFQLPSSSSSSSSMGQPAPTALISVRDTGIGIDPAMLPRVFDTFAQADRSLDRTRGGLGLGLALVKGLVELHGGQVEVASPGPGQGSEFTVRLPLAEYRGSDGVVESRSGAVADQHSTTPSLHHSPLGRPPHLRVLLVEDNRDVAETLRDILKLEGYEVAIAETGPAGVAIGQQFRPHVVLCDIGLPGMDGYAVAAALRQSPETAAARLIAVTGYGQEEDRSRSLEAGFEAHLTKPLNLKELKALLR
jgi:PAS domain S-box-containing protein